MPMGRSDPNSLHNPKHKLVAYLLVFECSSPIDHRSAGGKLC